MGEMDLVASCGLQVLEQCSVCKTHNNALKELAQDIETAIVVEDCVLMVYQSLQV